MEEEQTYNFRMMHALHAIHSLNLPNLRFLCLMLDQPCEEHFRDNFLMVSPILRL